MTVVTRLLDEWAAITDGLDADGVSVGFVPTMGALHAGHCALMKRSLTETDVTVVSIFVNPAQFDDPADLEAYPRTLESDVRRLEDLGVHHLLVPDGDTIYPDAYRYQLSESELSTRLCGAARPGHFDGVLTVVMRLFLLVKPHVAYFGEKDYQQYLLVKGMVEAFHMGIDVRACPIVREPDGLAMSSRNVRLSPNGRGTAAAFARILRDGPSDAAVQEELERHGVEVDYVESIDGRRFGAVVIDGVRLIDNVPV